MKKILMISTGGTIASDNTGAGLKPALTGEDLLKMVPGISKICECQCINLFALDSTNITPAHWVEMAHTIQVNYDSYDGFVIAHGTDTMAYTAAALSYLVQNSAKPIVLTGAQKPILFENTDSKVNLLEAFALAASEKANGVMICFNGHIILGTHARKARTHSARAFESANFPEIGLVRDADLPRVMINVPQAVDLSRGPVFFDTVCDKVALLKMVPGTKPEYLSFLLNQNDALVIESYGDAGLPGGADGEFYQIVKEAVQKGKIVVMTTQVAKEGSDLAVYDVGYHLKHDLGLLEAYDMTTEAVLAKLMWILGQTHEPSKVREMFLTPISNDFFFFG